MYNPLIQQAFETKSLVVSWFFGTMQVTWNEIWLNYSQCHIDLKYAYATLTIWTDQVGQWYQHSRFWALYNVIRYVTHSYFQIDILTMIWIDKLRSKTYYLEMGHLSCYFKRVGLQCFTWLFAGLIICLHACMLTLHALTKLLCLLANLLENPYSKAST